jgi:hypothetical protein
VLGGVLPANHFAAEARPLLTSARDIPRLPWNPCKLGSPINSSQMSGYN